MDGKKKSGNVWVALILAFFFWVPLLNVFVFLPGAIFLSAKQLMLIKKNSEKYGGMILSIIILLHALISMVFSVRILLIGV